MPLPHPPPPHPEIYPLGEFVWSGSGKKSNNNTAVFFPRLLMVILAPRKFFLCLQKVKTISSFLHYRNHPLSSSSSLSPPTLETFMHALTKWTARQWRLIYSNKKYKKTREIQAKWPNRATTSFLQGSSSSFHRWFSVCIPFSSIPSYGTQTKAFFFSRIPFL